MPKAPKLLTSAQACDRIGIDRSTLSRWVAFGQLTPAMRLPGTNGAMLFHPADVARLAAEYARSPRRVRMRQRLLGASTSGDAA